MDDLKMLPRNIEAENSILSTILVNPESIGETVQYISPGDFYDGRNRVLYDAMVRMFVNGESIDAVTVADKVRYQFKDGRVVTYLTELLNSFVPVSVKAYCEILREDANRRKLIKTAYEMMEDAYDGRKGAGHIISFAVEELYNLRQGKTKEMVHAGAGAMETTEIIEKNHKHGGDITGIPTGFDDIDREINGLNRGDFIVLAARSSMGKTALALNMARNVSRNHTTAYFSLEMPVKQLIFRMFSMMTNIRVENIRKGRLDDKGFSRIVNAGGQLYEGKLMIDDTSALAIAEIKAKCRKLKMKEGLDVVFVDYIGLIESNGKFENRQQEISKISRGLKNLAMELDVAVIALSQLNRAPEARSGNRPQLGDLRESGAIEQDADIVILLYRDDYYNPDSKEKGVVECIIAKNRNGPVGVKKLGWCGEFQTFINLKKAGRENDGR